VSGVSKSLSSPLTPDTQLNMRHTLSIVVADQPGELSRIVGLFSARGFNIETVSVGQTPDAGWARVTVVTRGDDRTIEQIVKQCSRLARVREVQDITTRPHIEREMALIDVEAPQGAARQEVLSLVGVFRAKIVDISQARMIVEASGNKEKVEALIELLRPLGIRDITRTGSIAIGRLSAASNMNEETDEVYPDALNEITLEESVINSK
jgi:acetolactate synthase I/III small subunit